MRVEIMKSDRDVEAYSAFILKHDESLLYYSIKYKNFLEELLECESDYLLAKQDDDIVGVLPMMKKRGAFGIVYNSLPFYGSNGGIIAENKEAVACLIDKYNELVSSSDVLSSVLIENPLYKAGYSGVVSNMSDMRIGQWTRLEFDRQDPEAGIYDIIDSTTKRNIKKAIKSGITVKVDNMAVDFLYSSHVENMQAIGGRAKSESFFRLLSKHFKANEDYKIYIAEKDGKEIASLLLFYFNKTVEYYTPTILGDYRTFQPLSLLIKEAMREASEKGYRWWNWGGTWYSQDGVQKFKNKWGTLNEEYRYYIQLNNDAILNMRAGEILDIYGNFYVVPFSELKNKEE